MVRTAAFKSYSKVIDVSFLPFRQCEPTARREAPPDDKLREPIDKRQARMDCFVTSAPRDDVPSIVDRHTQPERVFDDAQADFAAQRHQRFRVELHATDR